MNKEVLYVLMTLDEYGEMCYLYNYLGKKEVFEDHQLASRVARNYKEEFPTVFIGEFRCYMCNIVEV